MPADGKLVGWSIAEIEALARDKRVFIHHIRRDGAIMAAEPETRIQAGDVVSVSGRREVLVEAIGPAVERARGARER